MKVLVTGGSGFIGSHVVDKLRDRGVRVRIFDMVFPTFRSDIEFYQGSLLDFESVRMAMNGIDAIFHLGAVADVKDVFEDPHSSEAINVRGTINVLEAARRCKVNRVIYGSTTWVYSAANEVAVDEDTALLSPSHLYTATKIASEYYCRCYTNLYNLQCTVLRYGIPYGPRARAGAVIPIFVQKALSGQPLTIAGDGLQYRRFVYVEDLAEGNVQALKPAAVNRTYNLDGDEKVSIKQIAEIIRELIGNVGIEFTPARPGDFSGKEVSSVRARQELGWQPRIKIEEGIRRYIDWYKQEVKQRDELWKVVDGDLKK